MTQNSKYKNDNKETKNDIPYENNFHIKSLKMSKIPTNKKKYKKLNLNLSKKKLNSLINFNYLMIKNHISPKIKLMNENKKLNNLSEGTNSNDNDSKFIEVNRANNSHCSKILNDIPYQFNNKQKENKKIYTRNIIHYKYDSMKENNYSKDNYSKFNLSKINTSNNSNNNSYANFHVKNNLEEFEYKRANDRKIHHTKSMNLLNLNINNENEKIKSLLKSSIANKINYISINSENKSLLNNTNKINRAKNNNYNLNLYGIKKVNTNTNIYKTKQNSPLTTFNNNFIHSIFNRSKVIDKENKENFSFSNNVSTLSIYDFNNNIKYFSKPNNATFNAEKGMEKEKTMQIPIHKLTKLKINNNSSVLIPKGYNRVIEQKNINKKIKNIPIMKVNKVNNDFNLQIKTHNNTLKNNQNDACICNNQNYLKNNKNVLHINSCTNKNKKVLKCITKNNSNRIINTEKIRLIKKLQLNNILSNLKSNKKRKINYKISKENSNNNLSNKENKSFLNINNYIEKAKRENENIIIQENNRNINMNDKYFSSRNLKNNNDMNYIKFSNNNYQNNSMYNRAKFNNLENKNKIVIKKESRVLIASTIPRYNCRANRIINNENDKNKLNLTHKNDYKNNYKEIVYKTGNNCFIMNKSNDFYCICQE